MQFDLHTHTIASGHGTSCTISDIAKAARRRRLSLVGISDHGPATPCAGTVSYFRSLLSAPRTRCGVCLMYGAELNILTPDGDVDLKDDLLRQLDFAIISMHPQTTRPGNAADNTRAYIEAMKHPQIMLIGHCDDPRYPADYPLLVEAAKEYRVLLEINEASLMPGGYRGDTRETILQILRCCRKQQHPVVLSSDSHGPSRVGDFTWGKRILEEARFPMDLVLNYRLTSLLPYLKSPVFS